MCQSVAEGGHRCDCDNGQKRRFRRRLDAVLSDSSGITRVDPHDDDTVLENMEQVKDAVDDVNEKLERGPVDGQSQEEFDAEREKEISVIGASILRIAEEDEDKSSEDYKELVKAEREKKKLMEQAESLKADVDQAVNEAQDRASDIQERSWSADDHELSSLCSQLSMDTPPYHFGSNEDAYIENLRSMDTSHLSEQDKTLREDALAVHALYKDADKKYGDYDRKSEELMYAYEEQDERVKQSEAKVRARSLRGTLHSVRDMGGYIAFTGQAPEQVMSVMKNDVSQNYPRQWLSYHNDAEPVILEEGNDDTVGEDTAIAAYFTKDSLNTHETDGQLKPAPQGHGWTCYDDDSPLNASTRAFFEKSGTSFTTEKVASFDDDMTLYSFSTRQYTEEEPPHSENWERKPYFVKGLEFLSTEEQGEHESDDDFAERAHEYMQSHPVWVLKDQHTLKVSPRIQLGSQLDEISDNARTSCLTHELGHRMEQVIPEQRLTRMEHAFLRRRKREGAPKEVSYEGFLREPTDIRTREYTSKVYMGYDSTEVFTTGMESVFYGEHDEKDKDHQSFVVGVLATLR